jgi:hypothetical protein
MFSGLATWLGSLSVAHAGLLAAGSAAIASPIVIHLLNRRRFKIVDWAAIDFLLEANRRNRRRILLENLLLLLVRCLVIFLIGLLISRPQSETNALAKFGLSDASVERIVLLDDSASMQVRVGSGNNTSLDEAKESLIAFVRKAAQKGSGDTLTLLLTSQPSRPIVNGEILRDGDNVEGIVRDIENIKPSDLSANLEGALSEVHASLASRDSTTNQALYVVTDLRRRDWAAPEGSDQPKKVTDLVRQLSTATDGVAILDVGSLLVDNLQITDIAPQSKSLAVGVDTKIRVTVHNAGEVAADSVEVNLAIGDAATLSKKINTIRAGESRTVDFVFTFRESGSYPIEASLAGADRLPADNQRYYAARVEVGLPVLIVDGDPSSDARRSESLFLREAVAPPGDSASGNRVEVITENRFESIQLDDFRVIFLCNLHKTSDERLKTLEQWVADGGGLVVSLGAQIDVEFYNRQIFKAGKGLLPIRLTAIEGDPTFSKWAHPRAIALNHKVTAIFSDDLSLITRFVQIFHWYGSTLNVESDDSEETSAVDDAGDDDAGDAAEPNTPDDVTVLARWTTEGDPLAIVEKSFGDGRVIVLTTSVDRDWTNWPADDSFVIWSQEIVKYIATPNTTAGDLIVGQPLSHRLDPSRYHETAKIKAPKQDAESIPALPDASGLTLTVAYDETDQDGFYEMQLSRRDEIDETLLFAANLHPTEGRLKRMDPDELSKQWDGANVVIKRGMDSLTLGDEGSRSDLWPKVFYLLIVMLVAEQIMAWTFGRRRS